MNPKVNYGLWVTLLGQCWFPGCNNCNTLEGRGLDSGGAYARVAAGVVRETSLPSL